MTHFFAFLKKPYPFSSDIITNTRFYLFVCAFIVGFLMYFQPFGIAKWVDEYKNIKIIGYGFVCFIAQTAMFLSRSWLLNSQKMEYQYKIWHEIVWLTSMILANAIVVFLYSVWILNGNIDLTTFISFVGIVFSVGIFPVVASILINHHRFLTLNQKEASQIEILITDFQQEHKHNIESNQEISFVSDNEKDKLQVKIDSLIYIESLENYTQFYYHDIYKILQKSTLRGALKRFESQVSAYQNMVRTHRSFMVNLDNVTHITGNAQGYLLVLNVNDISVPVSRNYGPSIKKALEK